MDLKLVFQLIKKLPGKWFPGIIALIWLLGAGLRWMTINTCVILTFVVIAVWLIYILVKWLLGKGKGEEIKVPVPGLKERLIKAFESSRNLSWFLLIGSAGSGKTSVLRNSNLDFSYIDSLQEKPVTQGIEATKNCDLFFTKEAVILDTAGRYVNFGNEAQIKTEFMALLSLLKRYRKGRPVEGLIVSLDVARLLQGSDEVMEREARAIRDRIGEIISALEIKIPIYIVFTKCDMIYGFAEFFGSLDKDERMQVWGSTIRLGQQEKPEAAFEEQCRGLFQILLTQRPLKLALSGRQDRSSAYIFPLEFEAVYQKLARFVKTMFQTISQEKPIFRGFYFTSSSQSENPVPSFAMQNIAKSIGHQAPSFSDQPARVGGESKGYFIRDLFSKVIFSDRDIYAPTKAVQRRNTLLRLGICAAVMVVLLAFTTAFTVSYVRNKNTLSSAQNAVAALKETGGITEADRSERLGKLRESIVQLERFTPLGFLWRNPRNNVAVAARRVYLLEKYGSGKGWEVKLWRKVKIPLKVVKFEGDRTQPIEDAEIKADFYGKERKVKTNKKGSTEFVARVNDGKATIVFSTSFLEPGYEPQRQQAYEVQPGELVSASGVQFIFSKSMRAIAVHCIDQSGKNLSGVPVSIIGKGEESKEYGKATSNEQGIASFDLDIPESTELQVYFNDSPTNYKLDTPYELTIESGKVNYTIEQQLSRRFEISVIASITAADGTTQLPKPQVSVSVGGKKLGVTGNTGEWKGTGDIEPTQDNVKTDPNPRVKKIEETDSGYSILLEYGAVMPEEKPKPEPKQEPKPVPKPEPPPSLQFAAEMKPAVPNMEVWVYMEKGSTGGLKFTDEMSFESAGKQYRLIRLEPKASSDGRLELPKEVEGSRILLYHPDYWPQRIDWQDAKKQIKMVSLTQPRSLKDFDRDQIDGAEYFYNNAQKYYKDRKLNEAIRSYQNAMRLTIRLRYYLGLGWAYYENGQKDKSLKQASTGLKIKLTDDPGANEKILKMQLQELVDLSQ